MAERDQTTLVQLKARMREPLRVRLEQEAKRRGVSINAEIVDRLERSFERQDLLPEVLSLTFTRQTAGLMIVLGTILDDVGQLRWRFTPRGRVGQSRLVEAQWVDDPAAYEQALLSVIALLNGSRPKSPRRANATSGRITNSSLNMVRGIVRAIRGRGSEGTTQTAMIATIRSLLGGLADRLETRPLFIPNELPGSARPAPLQKELMAAIAAGIRDLRDLINTSPRTPSEEEMLKVMEKKLSTLVCEDGSRAPAQSGTQKAQQRSG